MQFVFRLLQGSILAYITFLDPAMRADVLLARTAPVLLLRVDGFLAVEATLGQAHIHC